MKSRKSVFALAVLVLVGILSSARSWAQDSTGGKTTAAAGTPSGGDEAQPTPALTPFAGVEGLNNRLNQLEKSEVVLTTEHNYLDLSDPSGDVIFKIGGNVQEDYRSYFQPSTSYFDYVPIGSTDEPEEGAAGATTSKSTSTFLNRKTRLDLIAIFDHLVGFRYQAELGSTGYAIQDAYAFIKADPALQFQAGKFKVPIGLERLQNDTDNLFVERALPTDLVPNRDLGAEATGSPWNGVNYAVALTAGTPDNYTPNNADDQSLTNGKELSGRLFLTLFKGEDSFLQDLGFGISGRLVLECELEHQRLSQLLRHFPGAATVLCLPHGRFAPGRFLPLLPAGSTTPTAPSGYWGNTCSRPRTWAPARRTPSMWPTRPGSWRASWVIGGKASLPGCHRG